MDTFIALAPAKLNLFLHITGRRPDGYHNLQTVFQFLDYCDELTFTARADNKIHLTTPLANITEENNLIVRAAKLLQRAAATSQGVDITLKKLIPMGGGLGGGSSDAATTLVALNKLWQLELPPRQLAELGLQLGADVPVFVKGKAAWGEGVGEKLSPISLPEPWFLVIIPPCQVATAEIFNAAELTRDTPPITIAKFLTEGGHNDCEPVVRQRYPVVDQAINWLDQFAPAKLTGTGACLFASFDSKEQAHAIVRQLPAKFTGFVAKGLNTSPLYASYIGV